MNVKSEVGKDEREARAKNATTDGGQQLLLEIHQIKSEINDLKDQVNRRGSQAENSNWCGPSYRGLGDGYQPNRTSWGCQNCKQRGRGDECNHCFADIRLPIADILQRLFSLCNGHEGSFVA